MEKAVSIQAMFTDLPFYERFGAAKRAGFSVVEFGGWTRLDLSRVTAELAANALCLGAITGADGFPLTNPATWEEFHEYLSQSVAVAKSFGCRRLIIQSAYGAGGIAADASPADSADFTERATAAHTLIEAAKNAERAGVVLLLKPAPPRDSLFAYPHSNSSAGSLVKVINSPALRLLFTVAPAPGLEGREAEAFAKYRSHIGCVHIEGRVGDAGGVRRIGEALAKAGYGGRVGFVLRAGDGEQAVLREIASVF